jgi:hypothetical protein
VASFAEMYKDQKIAISSKSSTKEKLFFLQRLKIEVSEHFSP